MKGTSLIHASSGIMKWMHGNFLLLKTLLLQRVYEVKHTKEFVRRFILIDTNYETNNMHKISNTYTCNFLGNAPLSIEWVAP